jgi:uncharacterized membrane protein
MLSKRSIAGVGLTVAAAPLLYRGLTGQWPEIVRSFTERDDTRRALGGDAGIAVRDSVRVEQPIADVFRFWRRFENLPQFMEGLESVTEGADGRSHWVARGVGGLRAEWDAEIVNEVENKVIGWRTLPDSDVAIAGSVNFDGVRGGRGTQVTVSLQYAAPGGRASDLLARLLGRAPAQTIREDLRRLKQVLEAGELARAVPQKETVQ